MSDDIKTCLDCEETFDPYNDGGDYSEPRDGWICQSCWSESFNSASTAFFVEGGEAVKYLVTDNGVFDAEYLEPANDVLTRAYHRTDGWRGYYETRPTGDWTEVQAGWTTGNWGDSISDSKQAFNRWAEALIKGETDPGHPVWVIADPTSNVFSTAIGVFAPVGTEVDVPAL